MIAPRIWQFVFAIIAHNIPEGMAVGVSAGGGMPDADSLAMGIALQDVPEGLVIALVLAGARSWIPRLRRRRRRLGPPSFYSPSSKKLLISATSAFSASCSCSPSVHRWILVPLPAASIIMAMMLLPSTMDSGVRPAFIWQGN